MQVSIIIPAHNAEATLAECLEACLAQTCPETEIVVVDDGSTDATSRIARQYPVHYIRQEQSGPAAARNCGAREAQGAFLVYTDSDCVPETGWVEHLLERFDEDTAAVGGTYTNAEAGNLLADFVHEEIMMRHETFTSEVDFLGSFNVAYRREAFETAGGFDEDFKAASGEDNDLAYRLQEYGRLRFAPEARVAHHHPTRLGPYLRTQGRHGFWRVKLYTKHPKRASGDRYAPMFDLIAPQYALTLTLLLFLVVLLAAAVVAAGGVAAGLLVAVAAVLAASPYLVQRLTVAYRIARRAHRAALAPFGVALLYARDMARAIGMLRGLWHFVARGRKTA